METDRLAEQAEGSTSPLRKRRPVLILGLGNPMRGDDGIGPVVVEALERMELPPEVEVLDGGTAGLALLDTVAERRRLLVVDAAEMGRPAGTIVHTRLEETRLAEDPSPLSPHQLGLAEVLSLAGRLEVAPAEVQIFAVQPGHLGWGKGLSPAVQASLSPLIAAVLAEIGASQEQMALLRCSIRRRHDGQEDPGGG